MYIYIHIYIYIYIHTQGLLESGIQFDASKTFPFQCGGGDVIKGLFVFKLLHECSNFCVHYLLIADFGWVYMFYVGHIDKIVKPFSML
jgi:hypothetical protein